MESVFYYLPWGRALASTLAFALVVALLVTLIVVLTRRNPAPPTTPATAQQHYHYRASAEEVASAQHETARQLEKIMQELADIRTRLTSIERILRDVE